MGFFNKLFKTERSDSNTATSFLAEPETVYSPLKGTAIPLSEIGDGVFSEGVLGPGCGIRPSDNTVTAPFDGTVIQVCDTRHAVGLRSNDGIEILIHVGLDTVEMQGNGFQVYVECDQKVKLGQKLLTFDPQLITAAGHPDVTAVLITNGDEFRNVKLCKTGEINASDKLISVER